MESISFRAWDKEEKKMHKVKTIEFSRRGARIIHLAEVQSNGKGDHKRWHSSVKLIQSTGLKDKNGTEIYEGDIVKYNSVPNPFLSDKYFEIIQARSGEWRIDNYIEGHELAFCNHQVEVVGNIFENKELLRDKVNGL